MTTYLSVGALVSLFFGSSSCIYYSSLTWLTPLYVNSGLEEGRAATLLTVFPLIGMPASFVIPALADRSEDRRPWLVLTVLFNIFGLDECCEDLRPISL